MFNTLVLAPNVVSVRLMCSQWVIAMTETTLAEIEGKLKELQKFRDPLKAGALATTVYDLTAIDSHGYLHARRFSRMNRDVVIGV
jgi:hypothetical protein